MSKAATKRLRALAASSRGVWFVTHYETKATPPIALQSAREFPGLIFYHQLDQSGERRPFIAYWESREDFIASRVPLEERLGTSTLHREAWVRQLTVPKESLWKRISLYGVLVHLVAVLGALAALEHHYEWLFEQPTIQLDLEETEPANLTQGAALRTQLIFGNETARVPADISALEVRLTGASHSELVLNGGSYSVRERDTLKVPIRTQELEPGRYRLEVQGFARSGQLRGQRHISLGRSVVVWSRAPQVEVALDLVANSRPRMTGELLVGEPAPAGLDCQATLTGEPALRFGPIDFPGVPNWPDPTLSQDGYVSVQTWTTPSMGKFSVTPFHLYLDGHPADGWEQVRQRVAVKCVARIEGKLP